MRAATRFEWWLGLLILLSVGACDSAVDPLATQWELPARPADARSATELVASWGALSLEAREEQAVAEVLSGNVPSWIRPLRTVTFEAADGGDWVDIEVGVLPDYLAVGSDNDFLWLPLTPQAATRIGAASGMMLPTPQLVDTIWRQAVVQVAPRPIPPSEAMTTVPVFVEHRDKLMAQRDSLGIEPGEWVAGHKKDVVLTARLNGQQGKVAIYGWHRLNGNPIQPVYTGHTDRWVDYSHGIRLVTRSIRVDGEEADLIDVLQHPTRSRWFSEEGALTLPQYD